MKNNGKISFLMVKPPSSKDFSVSDQSVDLDSSFCGSSIFTIVHIKVV